MPGPPSDNLFVSGLPIDCTLEQVKAVFGQYGTVKEAKVLPVTPGKTAAAAFVNMGSVAEATWILENVSGNVPQNLTSPVNISYALPKSEKGFGKGKGMVDFMQVMMGAFGGDSGGWGGGGGGGWDSSGWDSGYDKGKGKGCNSGGKGWDSGGGGKGWDSGGKGWDSGGKGWDGGGKGWDSGSKGWDSSGGKGWDSSGWGKAGGKGKVAPDPIAAVAKFAQESWEKKGGKGKDATSATSTSGSPWTVTKVGSGKGVMDFCAHGTEMHGGWSLPCCSPW